MGAGVQVTSCAAPLPGRVNEDVALADPRVGVVVDGAGLPPEFRRGCQHSVAWYADALCRALFTRAASCEDESLAEALAVAIAEVAALHGPGCDLRAGSPSATVAAYRVVGEEVEYLVLCDATCVLVTTDATVTLVSDHRLDEAVERLAVEYPREHPRALRRRATVELRGREGGYWAAGAEPAEASHALVGRCAVADVAGIVLASDGATRGFERLGLPSCSRGPVSALVGRRCMTT